MDKGMYKASDAADKFDADGKIILTQKDFDNP